MTPTGAPPPPRPRVRNLYKNMEYSSSNNFSFKMAILHFFPGLLDKGGSDRCIDSQI